MAKVKAASTLQQNKHISESSCPITYVMHKIGGHWKPIILYYLLDGPKRYSELKRLVPGITEKMLAQHLKQLKDDGMVDRRVEQAMPPVTFYSLTASGERLGPVLLAMADWAMKDSDQFEHLVRAMGGAD